MTASTDGDLFDPNNTVRLFKQGETLDNVLKLISESDDSLIAVQPDGSSLLHSFSVLGCFEVVKLLWEKGAQPSILKIDDSTLLHSAVRTQDRTQDHERAKILEIFLSSDDRCLGNSMPIDYQNSRGWTALKLAARKNLEQCVEVLLKRGADPDIVDHEMYTPLHNAVFNADIVKLLLSKAKTINSQNEDGETALCLATTKGLVDSALTLLEGGADPNIASKEGKMKVDIFTKYDTHLSHTHIPPSLPRTTRCHTPFSSCKRWSLRISESFGSLQSSGQYSGGDTKYWPPTLGCTQGT